MNEAFIQNAQHDINRDQSGKDENRFVRERIQERRGRALESGLNAGRKASFLFYAVYRVDRIAQRGIRRQVKRERNNRKLSLVAECKRSGCGRNAAERKDWLPTPRGTG